MSEEQRKKDIAIIEELYPPDSQFAETKVIGRDIMQWALQKFVDRYGWRSLSDPILSDMAFFCTRHEHMTQNCQTKLDKT